MKSVLFTSFLFSSHSLYRQASAPASFPPSSVSLHRTTARKSGHATPSPPPIGLADPQGPSGGRRTDSTAAPIPRRRRQHLQHGGLHSFFYLIRHMLLLLPAPSPNQRDGAFYDIVLSRIQNFVGLRRKGSLCRSQPGSQNVSHTVLTESKKNQMAAPPYPLCLQNNHESKMGLNESGFCSTQLPDPFSLLIHLFIQFWKNDFES